MKTVKVSVTLPADLVEEMRKLTSNLSAFIAQGLREYIERERTRKALASSAGAWKEENHPDLKTLADISNYVEHLRNGWQSDVN
ncbi:MAG: hypothetical protein PWP58_1353 [Bacillota bacterium]|jgi:post-segregation antitoxin (ccd killing protein)|nr:hypothetical protein [Bacillota bacterium]